MKIRYKSEGFTLIELLLVIGIIAVLAAAIIVAISPGEQLEDARSAREAAQASSIAMSMWECRMETEGTFNYDTQCQTFAAINIPNPDTDVWGDEDLEWENERPKVGDYTF